MNDQELHAVGNLPAGGRYDHFIKRVADWEEVWGLKSAEGWAQVEDDDGRKCIAFWPHPRYAEQLATGDWNDCTPEAISLAEFLSQWLPGMERDGMQVAVFPTRAMKGAVVAPARLRDDLEAECERYE